ncbi:MAG: hypothetical protein AAB502_10500 [Chloroflexota bacterium]
MITVFFGGSRSVSLLSSQVQDRIDNILSKGLNIVVGDANGADRAFQAYLAKQGYTNVMIFCSGKVCRNNLGIWKTTFVATDRAKFDFQHYAKKDARMADEADYGFFLWNGKSRGTLNSILMLLKHRRPALVYLAPKKRFLTLKELADLERMLNECDPATLKLLRPLVKEDSRPVAQRSLFG